MVMTGTMTQQDLMPVKITRMRPAYFLMEFDIQDITAYQAYDGTEAWMTAPWTGNPKPQAMPPDRARDLRSRADFDGPLVQWKEKGHHLTLEENDTIEGQPVYTIKVTRADSGVEFYSLDKQTWMIARRMYSRVIRGQEVPIEIYFRDYRTVEGVTFPFEQETRIGGQPYNALHIDAIELNVAIDPAIFRFPSK
jgi:hypothetical protein